MRGERRESERAAAPRRSLCTPGVAGGCCWRRAARVRPRPAARDLAGVGRDRRRPATRGDLRVQPERRRHRSAPCASTTRRATRWTTSTSPTREGNEHWMGVGLKPGLPDGTYTATYRVISADTHIVYGGLVFNIGHAGRGPEVHRRGPDRPERERQGHEGRLRRRAGSDYLTIALMLGGLAFLLLAWLPALRRRRRAASRTGRSASRAFARRLQRLLLAVAVVLGLARERARHPAAGGERRRRLAVGAR